MPVMYLSRVNKYRDSIGTLTTIPAAD